MESFCEKVSCEMLTVVAKMHDHRCLTGSKYFSANCVGNNEQICRIIKGDVRFVANCKDIKKY